MKLPPKICVEISDIFFSWETSEGTALVIVELIEKFLQGNNFTGNFWRSHHRVPERFFWSIFEEDPIKSQHTKFTPNRIFKEILERIHAEQVEKSHTIIWTTISDILIVKIIGKFMEEPLVEIYEKPKWNFRILTKTCLEPFDLPKRIWNNSWRNSIGDS